MSESKQREAIARNRESMSVGIGFPCHGMLPWQTAMALNRTTHALAKMNIPANIHIVAGSSLVTIARDVILENFLAGRENYLFWIDSDIVWSVEDFFRVLRLTKTLGLVAATYPLKRDPPVCVVNFEDYTSDLNEHGCVEATGLGLGFTCIRRDLVERFAATKDKMYHAGNDRMIIDAFRLDTVLGHGRKNSRGEDGAFFADMKELGAKIWLDPTICLGHVGPKEYRMEMVEAQMNELTPTETTDG